MRAAKTGRRHGFLLLETIEHSIGFVGREPVGEHESACRQLRRGKVLLELYLYLCERNAKQYGRGIHALIDAFRPDQLEKQGSAIEDGMSRIHLNHAEF